MNTRIHNLARAIASWRTDPDRTIAALPYAGLCIDEPELYEEYARLSPEERDYVHRYAMRAASMATDIAMLGPQMVSDGDAKWTGATVPWVWHDPTGPVSPDHAEAIAIALAAYNRVAGGPERQLWINGVKVDSIRSARAIWVPDALSPDPVPIDFPRRWLSALLGLAAMCLVAYYVLKVVGL